MKKITVKSSTILSALGLTFSLMALPLVCSMTGCASDSDNRYSGHEENHDISSRVRTALRDSSQRNHFTDVHVETNDEIVALSGYVNSQEQKSRAGKIAMNVPDVKEVINNIVVRIGS